MDIQEMLERENKNYNKIYLYADADTEDEEHFSYNAYEFSAYLLTKKFDTLELGREVEPATGAIVYVVRLSLEFVVEHFFGSDTTVCDLYIRVMLDNPARCIQWKADFKEFKKQRQRENSRLRQS